MILLKAFYRKKTIKNYFIIITLAFFIIFSLLFIRQFYINKNNEKYKSSFIFLETNNIEKSSIKNKNIKDCYSALKTNYGEIFVTSNSLDNNEIILPSILKKEYKENDELFIEEYNLNLKIKGFQDENNFYYINEISFEQIKNSDVDLIYIISLKNYINREKTIKDLENNFTENIISFYNNTNSSKTYETVVIVTTTFLKIMVIIFIILFLITMVNIYFDEMKVNKLYSVIGYPNYKIILIFLEKIVSLIFLPLIISLILTISMLLLIILS